MERDPFDLFLEKCAGESDPEGMPSPGRVREIAEEICPTCLDRVTPGSRYCSHCGALQTVPENITGTFRPRTQIKHHLAVTLLAIENNCEVNGRVYTRVHLKIRNLSAKRVHISLTYIDSVLIDITGRQYSPVDADELPEEIAEPIFPTWFYIYPEAYRDGVLLFHDNPVPLQRAIVCAMHQENEDELFSFELNAPPSVRES